MRNAVRVLVALVGGFGIVMAAAFFLDPAGMGERFFLRPVDIQGLATMRADLTAFFALAGGAALLGAWREHGDVLLIPAALYGIAIVGRAVSIAVDGALPTAYPPMAVEAALVGICLLGRRTFTRTGR